MKCLLLVIFLTPALALANALDHLRTTDDIGLIKVPNSGESQILVIPIWVGDEEYPPSRLANIQDFFDPAGGEGTFRQWWLDVSLGAYDPIPTVVDPIVYPDSCPLGDLPVDECEIDLDEQSGDWQTALVYLKNFSVKAMFEDFLTRLRDDQGIDLADFDVNGAGGPGADGYFDGVIVDSNIVEGLAAPLSTLLNSVTVASEPGGTGTEVTLGAVAMMPPAIHEFGHVLGFIDLYGGPTVNDLMSTEGDEATLSAFSRQQIGWGEVLEIETAQEIELEPVLDSGQILRVGRPPRYLLIENRSGLLHPDLETSEAGIYVYSVDEDQLPSGPFGFIDLFNASLYLPNSEEPYLNVAMPVDCNLDVTCALSEEGERRELVHASGEKMGFTLTRGAAHDFDVVPLSFIGDGPFAPDGSSSGGGNRAGCGCKLGTVPSRGGLPAWLSLCAIALLCRRWA